MFWMGLTLVGIIFVGVLAVLAVFVLGMRAKSPIVINLVRRVNRRVFNPRRLLSAGTPGAFASVIRHYGRTTGRPYQTPVGAVATEDGFMIALPYGSHADWLKNVLARGSAVIVHEGDTFQVDQPTIVAMEAAAAFFPAFDPRSFRLFNVQQCLHLRRVAAGGENSRSTAPAGVDS